MEKSLTNGSSMDGSPMGGSSWTEVQRMEVCGRMEVEGHNIIERPWASQRWPTTTQCYKLLVLQACRSTSSQHYKFMTMADGNAAVQRYKLSTLQAHDTISSPFCKLVTTQ